MNARQRSPQRKGGLYIFSALVLCAIAAAVYYGYLRPRQEKQRAPVMKTYSTTPAKSTAPEKSDPVMETRSGVPESSVETGKADSVRNDADAESVTSQKDASELEEAVSHTQLFEEARIKKQEAQEEAAADAAAADSARAASAELNRQAEQTADLAIAALVGHLNTLSPEEQRNFLSELRAGLINQLPPESEEILAETPDFVEQMWEKYLEKFAEQGYQLPE